MALTGGVSGLDSPAVRVIPFSVEFGGVIGTVCPVDLLFGNDASDG